MQALSAVKEGDSSEEDECKKNIEQGCQKVDQATQMEEHRALMPFNFAQELQNFSSRHVLALRQAKEKDDRLAKEYSVKDLRLKVDKTKTNQIAICRLTEHTNNILRNITDYNQSMADKNLIDSEARKAEAENKVYAARKKRDEL